jgi:hypothetical protein
MKKCERGRVVKEIENKRKKKNTSFSMGFTFTNREPIYSYLFFHQLISFFVIYWVVYTEPFFLSFLDL